MLILRSALSFALLFTTAVSQRGPLLGSAEYESTDLGIRPNVSYYTSNVTMPLFNVLRWDSRCASDDLLLFTPHSNAPKRDQIKDYAIIADQSGNMVWGESSKNGAHVNLHVVTYRGNNYLAHWNRGVQSSRNSYYRMLNNAYEEVRTIRPANGAWADHHGFTITPDNTALFIVFKDKPWDLSGLDCNATLLKDTGFQEMDIETGALVYEWFPSDHFSLDDMTIFANTHSGCREGGAFDAFHMNSVIKDAHGNYLVSMRYNSAATYINGQNGSIIWQLGGKNNSFATNDSFSLFGSHDARFTSEPNVVTIFDNHAWNFERRGSSRGLKVAIDTVNMTAKTLAQYQVPPGDIWAESQGSHQVLNNSHSFIGWGYVPGFSEFTSDGQLLCDTHFGPVLVNNSTFKKTGFVQSYRVYKQPWVGKPKHPPVVAFVGETMFVSWNGATEIKKWRLEGNGKDSDWVHIRTVNKAGFETGIPHMREDFNTWRLTALDATKQQLGSWILDRDGTLTAINNDQGGFAHNLIAKRSLWILLIGLIIISVLGAILWYVDLVPGKGAAGNEHEGTGSNIRGHMAEQSHVFTQMVLKRYETAVGWMHNEKQEYVPLESDG